MTYVWFINFRQRFDTVSPLTLSHCLEGGSINFNLRFNPEYRSMHIQRARTCTSACWSHVEILFQCEAYTRLKCILVCLICLLCFPNLKIPFSIFFKYGINLETLKHTGHDKVTVTSEQYICWCRMKWQQRTSLLPYMFLALYKHCRGNEYNRRGGFPYNCDHLNAFYSISLTLCSRPLSVILPSFTMTCIILEP